ncbi:hypothetical protein B0H14DRAFT_3447065 [Mycena olivaceomarginata]|nr:hypothetical protein B0H14DRAFT_3447065 [Mycena olivaceomarginata]
MCMGIYLSTTRIHQCPRLPATLTRLVRVPLLLRRLTRPALACRFLLLHHQLPLALLPLLQLRPPVLVHPCIYHRCGVVHRSRKALPSMYLYHSTNNYSSYAASPRVRCTGRGRRVPIALLICVHARELDIELRELSGEAKANEAEFALTQFAVGKDKEQEEQEINDSGIFLAEEFIPARSSTPPPSSPSSAV